MIVKNSGAVLQRMLQSWKHVISSYCICDTGSTDDTMNIIRSELNEVPGYLFEEPFVTFSVSRNRVLAEAETRYPNHYYVMMDDSCILEQGETLLSFMRQNPAPCYQFRIRNKTLSWVSTRITTLGMRYMYRVHEIVDVSNPLLIPTCRILDIENTDRTASRLEADMEMLDQDYNEYGQRERWLFYKALLLKAMGKSEEAVLLLKERIALGNNTEFGLFRSYMLSVPEMKKEFNPELLAAYIDIADKYPFQPEPLFYQAVLYQKTQQHALAMQALEKAIQIPITTQTVYRDVCEQYLPQMLTRYYYELGMKTQCLNVIRTVYQYGDAFHLEWEGYKRRMLRIIPQQPCPHDVVTFHPTNPSATFREETIEDYYKCIANYTISDLVVYHDVTRIPYFPNIKHIHWVVDDITKGHITFPVASIICRDEEHKKQVEQHLSPMYHNLLCTMDQTNPAFLL